MRLLFLVGLVACTILVAICLPQENGKGKDRGGGRGRGPWKELTDEEKAEEKLPLEERFQKFKDKFGKKYKDADQERGRKEKFRKNKEKIDAHNKLFGEGKSTYRMGINEFSDMDEDEFVTKMTGFKKQMELESRGVDKRSQPKKRVDLPESLDYRDSGMVTRVKYQGDCGSCWAHAAVGGLEALYFAHNGILVEFGEQQLVDCVYGRDGCLGGLSSSAIDYVKSAGGLSTPADYPYTGEYGSCQSKPKTVIPIAQSGESWTGIEEEARQQLVAIGRPIEIAFCADDDIQNYESGIYSETNPACNSYCEDDLANHEVLLVGYGTSNGTDYWIIKNSWSLSWGNEGYLYIERNRQMCNIGTAIAWAEGEEEEEGEGEGDTPVPEPQDCKNTDQGQEYSGTVAVTVSGRVCQRWDSQTPHEHTYTATNMPEETLTDAQNYCRNPDGDSGPWCLTTDASVMWDYCDIPSCAVPEPQDCKNTDQGQEYSGTVAMTVNGRVCQHWDSQTPHEHTYTATNMPEETLTDAQNYCRNPDGDSGPWCLTTDPSVMWGYCDIPTC